MGDKDIDAKLPDSKPEVVKTKTKVEKPKKQARNYPSKKLKRTLKTEVVAKDTPKKFFFNYHYPCTHDHGDHCVECYDKARKR